MDGNAGSPGNLGNPTTAAGAGIPGNPGNLGPAGNPGVPGNPGNLGGLGNFGAPGNSGTANSGNAGLAANSTTATNVVVTPFSNYPIQVPPGGFITISWRQ